MQSSDECLADITAGLQPRVGVAPVPGATVTLLTAVSAVSASALGSRAELLPPCLARRPALDTTPRRPAVTPLMRST